MSAEDYFALERNATHGRSTSLDELTHIGAFLATAEDAGAHERCEQEDLMAALRQCVGRLSQREPMLLQPYFFAELHLHEIGRTLDVTSPHLCQLKRRAWTKATRTMKDKNKEK